MFGPSMKPTMGFVNLVKLEKFEYISVGDIVCFKRKNSSIQLIHRVINIDSSGGVYIKGDNAWEVDYVSLNDIYSKVISFKKII